MLATISLYTIYRLCQVYSLIIFYTYFGGYPAPTRHPSEEGHRGAVISWMGRTYFITSKFSGYDMSWSLLLTTISRLCTTWSSSRASCAVVISYWLPHFQPPSYSRVASSTICIILLSLLFLCTILLC